LKEDILDRTVWELALEEAVDLSKGRLQNPHKPTRNHENSLCVSVLYAQIWSSVLSVTKKECLNLSLAASLCLYSCCLTE
jgi:hypothetical protein